MNGPVRFIHPGRHGDARGCFVELSAKDQRQPTLADFDSPFPYDGRPLAPLT